MGLYIKCSKFGSLINFQGLNRHWSVFLDQIPLQLDREGIKETEDGKRVVGGGGGGDYFKYYHQRGGDYLREAINQEMAIT